MTEVGFGCGLSSSYGALTPVELPAVYAALEKTDVSRLYPGFEDWFFRRVCPGVPGGERRVVTSFVNSVLAGVAICKRSETERKLCTLWVSPHARGGGIAAELACGAFEWLGTTKPLFTVPEEHLLEFGGLLHSWSFSKPVIYRGLYRPGRLEYVFNGHIGGMVN